VKVDEYLLSLERNLMLGSARWVADFADPSAISASGTPSLI